MFDLAINNEAIQVVRPISLLTTNPYIGDMSVMAKITLTKICSKCKAEKPINDFYRKKSGIDGLEASCKLCTIARQKKYYQDHKSIRLSWQKRYNQEHKERRHVYAKQYWQKNRERLSACNKQYNEDHKEELRRYRQSNKVRIALQNRQYCKTEAGKNAHKKKNHKRRALQAGVRVESFSPIEVFERDGYRCQLCGCKTQPGYSIYHSKRPELDHIIPLSLGGEHSKRNTQCLCRHCNATKRNTGKDDQLRLF